MKKICYLAGGFHSEWQEDTIKFVENLDFYTPKGKCLTTHGRIPIASSGILDENNVYKDTLSGEEYSCWDLYAIRNSDIVFVYGEKSNPGFGYLMEAAYAFALGKTVVMCIETPHEKIPDRYFDFAKAFSSVFFTDYESAINFLQLL